MADSGVLDVDQDFIGAWLLYGDLLVLDGSTSLLDDLSPLFGWKFRHVALNFLNVDTRLETIFGCKCVLLLVNGFVDVERNLQDQRGGGGGTGL